LKNISKIILLSVYLTTYTCFYPQEKKGKIRETLDLYYATVEILKNSAQTKNQETIEHELKLLHAKAMDLQKEALTVSVSLEQRCSNLIAVVDELIKTPSTP